MSSAIPGPTPKPLIGNVTDIDSDLPSVSFENLIRQYGEIVQLSIIGRPVILAGSQRLVHELSDQKRFQKVVQGPLEQVRNLAGDGLFTAHGNEENWALAHRILVPTFGPLSIRNMFDGMTDIASQLLQKWARFGDARIDVCNDFTKLALDTVAFCTFSHRFNSFYSPEPPPMVAAMARSLKTSGDRGRRIPGTGWLYGGVDREYQADIALQHSIADELVQERLKSGEKKNDLLQTMLDAADPVTGKKLDAVNIRYQLVTFLIAGHETTSGMLSFLFHYLLKNPAAAAKIRAEVDAVCGAEPIEFKHLAKFEYIDAALKETLRLKPTAPAISLAPIAEEETVLGKYTVRRGVPIVVVLGALHTDPLVWGEDALEFRPERMLDGGFANLPPDSWKPFGNGMRACIGRPFAWQEALLAVASIFQNFDIRPDNVSYELTMKSTLTIKPSGLFMHVSMRPDRNLAHSLGQGQVKEAPKPAPAGQAAVAVADAPTGQKMLLLYGSNSGTCKALAETLGASAQKAGFATTLAHLDEYAANNLPKDRPVAIVTASYEGEPTDDAKYFHQWLKDAPADSLNGVQFAVFGCGHPDWASTYHKVPTFIDKRMEEAGGKRLVEIGKGNASSADLFDFFDEWAATLLGALGGSSLGEGEDDTSGLVATIQPEKRREILRYNTLGHGTVISNTIVSHGGISVKRHIVFELPPEVEYRAGDYLEFLPLGPAEFVRRALARFQLSGDTFITLTGSGPKGRSNLPLDTPLPAANFLAGLVELGSVVTSRTIKSLVRYTDVAEDKAQLESLVGAYEEEIASKRISLLDLLERFSSINMPLAEFLAALPPMRMRQYSISSSPLDNPRHASLTIAVVEAPHKSRPEITFYGTATHTMSTLIPGSKVSIGVRPSSVNFHPPADPAVPILMACAGSGVAPFRAFLQDRAIQQKSGRAVGPAFLFFGCHRPSEDALYQEEMAEWEKSGVCHVRYAFSAEPEASEGCKHVQDRIWNDRAEFKQYLRDARMYFCGSKAVSNSVEGVMKKIYRENTGSGEDEAEEWYERIRLDRYAADIFG